MKTYILGIPYADYARREGVACSAVLGKCRWAGKALNTIDASVVFVADATARDGLAWILSRHEVMPDGLPGLDAYRGPFTIDLTLGPATGAS